jgi:3-oxoacyl-(acyl-carrier-protein) synthase
MKIERPNDRDLTPEEQKHLTKLRDIVRQAMADGRLSQDEMQAIQAHINADKKVTVQELRTIRQTIRESLGDSALEYDWG